ncbi:heterokaryon incompatibility protein-domain-containing protein [Hypoxylon argillaceum]|nr:heterokaryon incompatibility protein-domain-containing protein [Hypoxylon argillaceum]
MIKSCSSQHSCISADIPSLPTRVIQVGKANDDVRLVESRGLKERYICLSHCWGEHQPLRTMRANLSEHMDSLPWEHVPQCYRDLIQLSRLLGVQYIWIDSLCIIQDDPDDWLAESLKMCDVYENSWLTVASTALPNCSYELWSLSGRPKNFRVATGTTELGEPYSLIAAPAAYWHPTNVDMGHRQREIWPLLDRAWVFQEIMLSPRVLHFSRWELIWECRERTSCECGLMQPRSKDKKFQDTLDHGTPEQLQALWRDMVQGYSGLSLTVSSDKYVAFSGLAQKFSRKRPGSTYLAGLWDDSLARDILWVNILSIPIYKRHPEHTTMPSFDRAPSWSWMKMNNRVAFADSPSRYPSPWKDTSTVFDQFHFSVERGSCKLRSTYPTGPVDGGTVRLNCLVFDAQVKRTVMDGKWLAFQRKGPVDVIALRLPVGDTTLGFASENTVANCLLYLDAPADLLCGRGLLESDPCDVKCVPLVRARREWPFNGKVCWETDEWVMVLLPTGSPGEYTRIGVAILRTRYEEEAQVVKASSPDWKTNGRSDIITII